MPNIKTYDTPALGLVPSETGIQAVAAAARRGGAFFNQAAGAISQVGHEVGSAIREAGDVAVKYKDLQEKTAGAPLFATLTSQKLDQWNDFVTGAVKDNPTDPGAARRAASEFLEKNLEPSLEKFMGGFSTEESQKWAQAHVDRLRDHMFHVTTADSATLAGAATHNSIVGTINTSANTVAKHPESLPLERKNIEGTIDGLSTSTGMTPAQIAKFSTDLKEKGMKQLVQAAVMGSIAKGGDWKRIADDPENAPYISAAEIETFARSEKYYQRVEQSAQRSDRAEQEHAVKLDFHNKLNKLEAETFPKEVGEQPTLPKDYWSRLKELTEHPGAQLEPSRLNSMESHGNAITARLNKPDAAAQVSHDTTMSLLRRMRASDNTRLTSDDDIYDAFEHGKLNKADFKWMRDEYTSMKTPQGETLARDRGEFFKKFAPTIDAGMNGSQHSVLGAQRMYDFEQAARRQEDDLRKKGLDPHLAYDTRSEYYLGRPEFIAKNRVSLQDIINYDAKMKKEDLVRDKNSRMNLTGPGRSVISTTVEDKFAPPITWQFSPSRKQYRDPATDKLYDLDGKEIK